MAKEEVKKKPCHMCTKRGVETQFWKTACGLKLDKKERGETVLADEWEYVTCKACKKEKPADEPEDPQPEVRRGEGKRRRDR